MLSITSCDISDTILRIVRDLIVALIRDRNYNLMKSFLEMCTDLFESVLCKRERDKIE